MVNKTELEKLKFGCSVACSVWGDVDSFRVLAQIGICSKHKRFSTCEKNDCYDENRISDGLWLFRESEESPIDIQVLYDKIIEIQCSKTCEHKI